MQRTDEQSCRDCAYILLSSKYVPKTVRCTKGIFPPIDPMVDVVSGDWLNPVFDFAKVCEDFRDSFSGRGYGMVR